MVCTNLKLRASVPSTYGVELRWFHLGLLVALAFAALAAPAAAKPLRIVVIGDSLTAGYQLPADAAFPAILEKALKRRGKDLSVINASVSGDTVGAGLERLDWALGEGADAVIVELGANDMLRGIDPATTRRGLDEILTRLAERRIPVLLAGMLASPSMGSAFAEQFNGIFPALAKKHGVLFYPFFLDGVVQDPKFNLSDGMHPNRAGVERIVENILPEVERLLVEIASR